MNKSKTKSLLALTILSCTINYSEIYSKEQYQVKFKECENCKIYVQVNMQSECTKPNNQLDSSDSISSEFQSDTDDSLDNQFEIINNDQNLDLNNITNDDSSDNSSTNDTDLQSSIDQEDNSAANQLYQSSKINPSNDADIISAMPSICSQLVQELEITLEEQDDAIVAIIDVSKIEDKRLDQIGINGKINASVINNDLIITTTLGKSLPEVRSPNYPKIAVAVIAVKTIQLPLEFSYGVPAFSNDEKNVKMRIPKLLSNDLNTEKNENFITLIDSTADSAS